MDGAWIAAISGIVGIVITKVFDIIRSRRPGFIEDAQKIVDLFKESNIDLSAEVAILKGEVQKLQLLIAAFEAELIALGGDPVRIRRAVIHGGGT